MYKQYQPYISLNYIRMCMIKLLFHFVLTTLGAKSEK